MFASYVAPGVTSGSWVPAALQAGLAGDPVAQLLVALVVIAVVIVVGKFVLKLAWRLVTIGVVVVAILYALTTIGLL